MATADGADSGPQQPTAQRRGRARRLLDGSRALVRLAYRDPENLPERLTLMAVERLGEPSRAWARNAIASRPEAGPAVLAGQVRRRSATIARLDGAISGTPFFIALVPGYLEYLWREAQMVLRIAALYGRDPRELLAAAEMLSLRGVHPTVEAALHALDAVVAMPLPPKPSHRRSLRTWIRSVRMLLVFGGFLESRDDSTRTRGRPLSLLLMAGGAAVWIVTWIFPVTLMIVMAWSCEANARKLGRRAQAFYGGDAPTTAGAIRFARLRQDDGHSLRQVLRSLALFCSIAVPIAFIAYADHIRNTTGINWVGGVGAIVALSLVIATAVAARSR